MVPERRSAMPGVPPLRVLYALEGTSFGGVERQVQLLVEHLDQGRVEPLVTGRVHPQLRDWLGDRGVLVEALDPVRSKFDVRGWRELPARLSALRPDVVHAVQSQPFASQYVMATAMLLGVPVISTVHLFTPPPNRRQLALRRPLVRRLETQVVASGFLRDQLAQVGQLGPRVEMIDNGVEAPRPVERSEARRRLGLPADALVVGGALRLVPEKRADLIVAAGRRLGAQVLLVGDGPERERLARLGPDVHLPGFRDDAADLLRALDVCLHPCPTENQPLALVEAMLQEVPLVVADQGGAAELVEEGRTGLRAAPDPEAMADAARRVLADRELRQALVAEAAQVARTRFAPTTLGDRHHRLYDRVVARRGRWGDRRRRFPSGRAPL